MAGKSGRPEGEGEVQTKQEGENRKVVRIDSIKVISGAGNLRAFASITIAGRITVNDVRVIQQPNQQPWVSMPSRAYEKDGARKWAAIVELVDEKLKAEVSDAVLAEFAKLDTTNNREVVGWER
jgi:DNA-binding cell septation regulator SpoVG